ncbi:MAG: hypothetical protein ACJARP_002473 [Vicingaceae bacterium]|jgi:hypothetical protein
MRFSQFWILALPPIHIGGKAILNNRNFKQNLLIMNMKEKIVYLAILIGLLSCTNTVHESDNIQTTEVENLSSNLKYFASINCNSNFKNKPIFSALIALDIFQEGGDSIITFLDFRPGNLYFYSLKTNKFIAEYKIPTEDGIRAGIYKTYGSDSVLYFNREKQQFVIADSNKILRTFAFNHFYGDSAAKIITVRNQLEKIGNKIPMMISLSYNVYDWEEFVEIKKTVPVMGLFEIIGDSIHYNPIPFYNPIPEGLYTKRMGNRAFFLTNPKSQEIIYTYKNTDSLFLYNIETGQFRSVKILNAVHPIEPLIWKRKYPGQPMTAEKELELSARSSGIVDIAFSEKDDVYYRYIIISDGEDKGKNFLQVIRSNFTVIKEFEIPKRYQRGLKLINDQLFFTYYDREQQQIICEKFILPID